LWRRAAIFRYSRKSPGLGRGDEEEGFDDFGEAFDVRFVFREGFGIARGKFRDFVKGFAMVTPEEEMAAIGVDGEEGRIFGLDAVTEAFEFEFANYTVLEEADEIGSGGDAIAGPDFFGYGAATEDFTAFENYDFFAGAGEVCGSDEAVVTASDDDSVISSSHPRLLNATTERGGSVMEILQGRKCFCDSAAMTPPRLPMLLPPKCSASVLRISS